MTIWALSGTVAALLVAGVIAAGCAGNGGAKQAADATAATGTAAPTLDLAPTIDASRDGWSTAQALPVTPVAVRFNTADPGFDALAGARAIFGTYDFGGYQIELPDAWNGDVVYFAHGFRGNGPDLTLTPPPLREYFIRHGYAWAASSYSENGYRPGLGARDTFALRDIVVQKIGQAKHSYLYGQSMGGNVVTVSLETYPTAYDGALSECGALSGQGIVDYFLSWGALAGYFSGTDLTNQTVDAAKFGRTLQSQVAPALGTADHPTANGAIFASAIENLTGGPRPYFREGYAASLFFNFLVLVQAVAVPGAANAVAQNADTRYVVSEGSSVSTEQLNREIARVQANPQYQDPQQYPEFGAPSGKIQRPLLTLHGTGDLFVPVTMEQMYRQAADAAGAGDLLVQRAVRRSGHCNFSEQERERAFEDVVRWVQQGQKPAGEDLQGDLTNAGLSFTSPLEADDPGGLTP